MKERLSNHGYKLKITIWKKFCELTTSIIPSAASRQRRDNTTSKFQSQMTFRLCTPFLKLESHYNNKGIALITVILIIVILVAVVIELNRSSRSDIYDAANLSDGIKLAYIAKSGFYGATALLTKAPLNYNSLRDDWANMETISLQSNTLFPEGYFIAKAEDEAGKIPLNKLVNGSEFNPDIEKILRNLLSLPEFGLSQRKVDEIVYSIKDWIDADENAEPYGAESNYYSSLDPPYKAKNAPLDCIEELLMVKGITKEILYGTKNKPSLAQYVTANSEGLVNINTAPKMVLRSLNERISPDLADRLDEFRMKEGNDLSAIQWYKRVSGMGDIAINQQLITVKSNYFKITSTGKMNNMSKTITGVILREDKKSVKIVKWRQD